MIETTHPHSFSRVALPQLSNSLIFLETLPVRPHVDQGFRHIFARINIILCFVWSVFQVEPWRKQLRFVMPSLDEFYSDSPSDRSSFKLIFLSAREPQVLFHITYDLLSNKPCLNCRDLSHNVTALNRPLASAYCNEKSTLQLLVNTYLLHDTVCTLFITTR